MTTLQLWLNWKCRLRKTRSAFKCGCRPPMKPWTTATPKSTTQHVPCVFRPVAITVIRGLPCKLPALLSFAGIAAQQFQTIDFAAL